jgi:CheY-like chemotaxis protein
VLTRSKVFVEASGIPITQVNGLEDGSDKINIDKQKLTKILDHLVDNAKKFTSKGSIEVGYVVRNTYYEFYVKDSGIGIEKHMHDSIFDRFLQAERGMSRTYGGTGLGLSICKGYVNLMGGKIWLESEVGEGTTFFFSVPTVKLVSEPVYVIKEDVHSTDVKTVLVAEDEEVNMLYVREILQAKNIVILQAVNGLSAVEIFKNNPGVSLVLMDIKMPFMDGYAATKEIKLINPNVPIIAQTAYALSDDAEKVKSQGFDDYVAKPMTEDKLMKVVSKYINL